MAICLLNQAKHFKSTSQQGVQLDRAAMLSRLLFIDRVTEETTMPSLAEEQPSATHFLIFAASDGTKDPVCRYVAHLEAADGRPELKIEVTVRHPGGALLEATIR